MSRRIAHKFSMGLEQRSRGMHAVRNNKLVFLMAEIIPELGRYSPSVAYYICGSYDIREDEASRKVRD